MRRCLLILPLALVLVACKSGPTDAELDRLLAEARAANAAAGTAHTRPDGDAAQTGRVLEVSGQVSRPARLDWAAVSRLAQSHVRTVSTQTTNLRHVIDFRGLLVRDLLATHGPAPDVSEVTFVSLDGFRSTVDIEGLRRFDVLLAIEADGKALSRAEGGPIFLVFPHTSAPETVERYNDRYWAYYVSHVVVGTERIALRIGDRILDTAAFAMLPQVSRSQTVGWKVHWPSTPVAVHGVTLPDLLQSAGVGLPPDGRVIVRGKAATHRDPATPRSIPVADLARCPYLVVSHHGSAREPIPARLGGPLALAVPPACDGPDAEPLWIPFVEELVVEATR